MVELDGDDLFAGISRGPSIKTSNGSSIEADLKEAWKVWIQETDRPQSRSVPDPFRDEYTNQRRLKVTHEHLLRCIAGAARTRPHMRDPLDVRRATSAMKNKGTQRAALDLLNDPDAETYPWDWSEEEEENRCSFKDIEEHSGTIRNVWTPRDYESCGVLMEMLDAERLEFACRRTKLVLGQEDVSPSDVLRYSKAWSDPEASITVAQNPHRDSYGAGNSETDDVQNLDLDLDLYAEKLLIKGAPSSVVRSYHLDVPDDYWNAVSEYLDDHEDASIEDAYSELSSSFSWHPSDRKDPSW